jgi:hypothetical protein
LADVATPTLLLPFQWLDWRVIHGCQAGEGCCLLFVERAELGHVGEQVDHRGFAEASG